MDEAIPSVEQQNAITERISPYRDDVVAELKKITFASFIFHLRAATELHLPPYKGSTLRGAFGITFKETVCIMEHRDCDRCLLRLKCAYPYIFDTPIPEDSARMRRYERAPHPFVIEPPLETQQLYKPNELLSFGLTLIGKAIDYLPYFIYTFDRLGRERGIGRGRGRFALEKVSWLDPGGGEKEIYDGQRKVLANSFHPLTIRDLSLSQNSKLSPLHSTLDTQRSDLTLNSRLLTINYLTPTRVTYNGELHTAPEFHVIIRNLLRRLSNLCYFHCGEELNLDFKGIIERAKTVEMKDGNIRWHDWERYSARQDTRMKMGGFVGEVEYHGELAEFLPLLKLGERIHVGKSSTFGLGMYVVGAASTNTSDEHE
ncbi:MAG: CRISPR system precrRNA processing endoribonuclease RAMP protein Cas6 [Deltaproteobacteria bacterium]|nr:CRISPR system precrRNA processing endoribonuclease RAMP protein Cas6 [Deltaproteobacteria bacterium]